MLWPHVIIMVESVTSSLSINIPNHIASDYHPLLFSKTSSWY